MRSVTRYTSTRPGGGPARSRYDRRFYAVGAAVLAVAIAGKALGADAWSEYPAVELGTDPATLATAAAIALSGLAPLRRRARTRSSTHPARTASNSLPAGEGI